MDNPGSSSCGDETAAAIGGLVVGVIAFVLLNVFLHFPWWVDGIIALVIGGAVMRLLDN